MTNERAHDTLQAIGWYDGPLFVAPMNERLIPLITAASEKYSCDGADLLELLLRNDLMSGEEMHTVKEVE